MFRSVLDEMRRRRLLPVAALALLVAIIAPLLFMKGAPDGAPSADSAAPAAATPAKLPARAARLLAANDGDASNGATKGSAQDPFNPPSSVRAAAAAAAKGGAATPAAKAGSGKSSAKSTGTGTGKSTEPIPVVIKNDDKASSKSNSSTPSTTTRSSTRTISVDIRYGAKKDSKLRRAIPTNKAFYIHGKLVAVFVKYSQSRKKAVFAVAPGVHVSGSVSTRVTDNVRYVDIKPGSHARLTIVTPSRTIVSRRLDVVRAKARTSSNSTKATAASSRTEAACLLGKLTAMKPGDPLVSRDACEG